MPKSINWPKQYLNEILSEPKNEEKIALRLGNLYFNTNYFLKDDIVDIRVDHKVVGKAQIIKDLELFKIDDLNDSTIALYKSDLNSKEKIIKFLSSNYNQPVNKKTEVTVITYQNIICDQEIDVDN